jgi:hypothetical protein
MYKTNNRETVPYFLEENYDLLGRCSGLKNHTVSLYKTRIFESPYILRNYSFRSYILINSLLVRE